MNIGIGLPAWIPQVSGSLLVEWARAADEGPFSSLGLLDRLVYTNYEPLIALAGAAGASRRCLRSRAPASTRFREVG